MKNSIKIIVSVIVLLLSFTIIFAQKAKPTPKPTPKKVELKPLTKPTVSNENQTKADEFIKQGKAFWKELELTKAIDSFTKAVEISPNYLPALSERGSANFMIQKFESALIDFNKIIQIEPKNAKYLHFRGLTLTQIAISTKDEKNDRKTAADLAQRALTDFNQAIELESNNFEYFNGRGNLFMEFDFYKEAMVDFQNSVAIKPNKSGLVYLGLTKFYAGEGKGIEEVDKAISIDPQYAEAFYIRGTINRSSKRYEEAIADFDEAIRLNKYSAKYYNSRGMVHFIKQDGYAAVADFTSAIKENNGFAMAYYNRAFAYKKFPYSVSNNPNDNAIVKIRLQRQKMLEDLNMAIKYKPTFDAAYVERGLINSTDMRNKSTPDAETINRLNLALADFELAIKHNPKNADAYNGRASCYDDLGKKDLALSDYNKAIELDPELATAYMGRMAIYCEMGKKELSILDEKKIKTLGFAAINMCNLGGK